MKHFIWVFSVCKKYSFRGFTNIKGSCKMNNIDINWLISTIWDTRKPDLVTREKHSHRIACATMQSDQCHYPC